LYVGAALRTLEGRRMVTAIDDMAGMAVADR